MSKFHRNKKKHTREADKKALWLLGIAFLLVVLLFAFI